MRLHLLPLVGLLALPSISLAQKPEARGTFVDRAGKKWHWNVTASHTLFWDRQAYVPVGGLFHSHYLADQGQSDAAWDSDLKSLSVLKGKGITDLILDPVISAVDVPAPAWQRVVDYLDSNGFHYGISFGAAITTPLSGTVVKPSAYRIQNVDQNTNVAWNVADTDTARYLFCDKEGNLLKFGQMRVSGGEARATPDAKVGADSIAMLYPHKRMKPGGSGAPPDIWASFDSYRDRLLASLGQVKFGAGLRFFLDPLTHGLAVTGEADYLIPDSPAFRLEWEAWLAQRHIHIDDLNAAWRLERRDVKDFKQAASLIPLWADQRGLPKYVDPSSGDVLDMDVNSDSNRFWTDIRAFRTQSLSYYMNAMADVLKHEIAEVPVVYTYAPGHKIFTNPNADGGFDGLGIAAYGGGSKLVTGGADYAYSQSNDSAKSLWLLVTETQGGAAAKTQTGYASQQELFQDLDWLRTIGAKGFFVRGFQPAPDSARVALTSDQLDWVKLYGDRMGKESGMAVSQPKTLPFPESAAGLVHAGPIGAGGVWWVRSALPGRPLMFGSSYAGYTIAMPDGEATVMWSLRGPRETHLSLTADPRNVTVMTPDGVPIHPRIEQKKLTIVLPMDRTPVIIRAGGSEVFPVEAASDTIKQLQSLVKQALDNHMPAETYEYALTTSLSAYRTSPVTAYESAIKALDGVAELVQPFTWLEAENPESHTFTEAVGNTACSGSGLLVLNSDSQPGPAGYAAHYKFTVPADDAYDVWIACTPPGQSTSPFVWRMDSSDPHSVTEASVTGSSYSADSLVWLKLGRVPLKKGMHNLAIRVTERAGSGRFSLAMDSIVVTRSAFTPNGITRPPAAVFDLNSPLNPDSIAPKTPKQPAAKRPGTG
jgi:hypothetical protein